MRSSKITVTTMSHKGDISDSDKLSTLRNENSTIVVICAILVEIMQKNHVQGPHGQQGGHPPWGSTGTKGSNKDFWRLINKKVQF